MVTSLERAIEEPERVVPPHLDHPAFLYGSLEEFVDGMKPYVIAGIENDETVFVVARGDYLPALRAEIGDGADAVWWADTQEWHPHPSTRLRAFYEFVVGACACTTQDNSTRPCSKARSAPIASFAGTGKRRPASPTWSPRIFCAAGAFSRHRLPRGLR